jgi:hypothetical protein
MNKNISIFTKVSGNIQQDIELFIDISSDEFIEGLNSGKYATTISHCAENTDCGQIIQLDPFQIIGKVVYQEALEDFEISDFEIETPMLAEDIEEENEDILFEDSDLDNDELDPIEERE